MTADRADDLAAFLEGSDSCALFAYMAVAAEARHWPPDSELTRRRANDLYEAEARRTTVGPERTGCPPSTGVCHTGPTG
jgi:hypothetical protein